MAWYSLAELWIMCLFLFSCYTCICICCVTINDIELKKKKKLNWIATGIVINIRASSSHIGRMMAFSEHRRWIICMFDRRSIMNGQYWHNQQVGYLCFIPFLWEQRGVTAAVADQTAMISHLLPMCWATGGWLWGHVGAVWEPRIDRVKLAFAL